MALTEPFEAAVVDLRFVKPLHSEMLSHLRRRFKRWYVFSDSAKAGGVASALLEWLSEDKGDTVEVVSFEYPDAFIPHGNTKAVEESMGLLPEQLASRIV